MTENLKRGDQIVTSGGIIGTVERVMDNDRAEVIVGDDTKVEIIRSTGVQGFLKAEEPKK
jgi:preprotein translocase subunit YajC